MEMSAKHDKEMQVWGPDSAKAGGPKTLADEALQRIREDIVSGLLTPASRLQPDALKDRYDIGLSPIREALSRLAAAGLVRAEGQRGFFVAPVSEAELLDVTDLRCRFNVLALAWSIERGDESWETEVVGTYYQLEKLAGQMREGAGDYADEWERRNRAFHTSLEGACGSPWLRHFCQILYDQSERYRRRFVRYPRIPQRIYEEHRKIMEAALARDADTACETLAKHIWSGIETVRKHLLQSTGQSESSARPPTPSVRSGRLKEARAKAGQEGKKPRRSLGKKT